MFVSCLTSFVSSLFLSILLQFFNKEITDKIPSHTEETIVFIYLAIYTLANSIHQAQLLIKNLNFVAEKLTCRRYLAHILQLAENPERNGPGNPSFLQNWFEGKVACSEKSQGNQVRIKFSNFIVVSSTVCSLLKWLVAFGEGSL